MKVESVVAKHHWLVTKGVVEVCGVWTQSVKGWYFLLDSSCWSWFLVVGGDLFLFLKSQAVLYSWQQQLCFSDIHNYQNYGYVKEPRKERKVQIV